MQKIDIKVVKAIGKRSVLRLLSVAAVAAAPTAGFMALTGAVAVSLANLFNKSKVK